jgi:uncharacterized membrane protein YdbT with pleckstrin-like domain
VNHIYGHTTMLLTIIVLRDLAIGFGYQNMRRNGVSSKKSHIHLRIGSYFKAGTSALKKGNTKSS